MAILPQRFALPTMPSGNSVTSAVELPGVFVYMYLEVPTMSAGYTSTSSPIYIQGSSDGVTFRRFANVETNTNVVGANDFTIASSVSQRMVLLPNFAMRYIKVEISGTATGSAAVAPAFTIVCVSNQ